MQGRGAVVPNLRPGPFACRGCRAFVTGTESGHCPRCGLAPPRIELLPAPPAKAWSRDLTVLVILGVLVIAGLVFRWYWTR